MKIATWTDFFRIRPLLAASLLFNLVFGILAVGMWLRTDRSRSESLAAVAEKPVKEANPASPPVKAQPLQWSQLDAPDFATFVKNLRGIGCPEATIRDIVAGELSEIYAEKRQQVAQAKPSAGHQAELRRLDTEQAQLLARLVPASASTPGGAGQDELSNASKTGNAAGTIVTANNPASGIPIAFLVGNAPDAVTEPGTLPMTVTDPTLDPRTAEQLNQMRAQFAETLQKEAGQDPASPVYRHRWHKIQRDQDEFFSSMYGGDAFVRMQLEAMHKAAAAGK